MAQITSEAEDFIPYNRAYVVGRELFYIAQAVTNGDLKGDGPFTQRCSEWFEQQLQLANVLLTTSCTTALEMAAMLLNVGPGDEVIVPTFAFTSTANAFVLRGAKPIFVDIREDTLNIDVADVERKLSPRTKAVCPIHYAGVGSDMSSLMTLSEQHGFAVVEDAAQAVYARYQGKPLGGIGQIGAFSFHETKNFSAGEGGAIVLNDPQFVERAEVLREKGTNRSKFFRGEIDKYSWVDIGGSFLPSEVIAAFLFGQLERADEIQTIRHRIWNRYYEALSPLEEQGKLRLPVVPPECEHNAHLFYLLLPSEEERDALRSFLWEKHISAVFHYVPLHLSVMGQQCGGRAGDHPRAEQLSARLLRLPLFCSLSEAEQQRVIDQVFSYFSSARHV